jgi:hypothetical protein
LRYCRSRFFTFVFFIQTLTGISSGKNNKSCGIFHNEPKKIGFAFFRFFYNFLHNLQETAKSLYYWSYPFAVRPLKRFFPLQCSPWAAGQRRSGQIPANRQLGLAGHGLGRGLGDRFLGLVGAGRSPARGGAGGQAWLPPRPVCRRGRLDAGGVGWLRS